MSREASKTRIFFGKAKICKNKKGEYWVNFEETLSNDERKVCCVISQQIIDNTLSKNASKKLLDCFLYKDNTYCFAFGKLKETKDRIYINILTLNNVSLNVRDSNNNAVYDQYSHSENGVVVDGQTIKFASPDTKTKYTDEARYNYSIDSEGHYLLIADSQDNAGNSASEDTELSLKNKREKIVHIDTKDPMITEFRFESKGENGSDIEYSTYGYFFKEDTIVRVYVKDEDVSSGINYVTLYRRESGQENPISATVYASGTENWNSQEGYAEFKIEKGFKGQIWAIVVDNVASSNYSNDNYRHTSGLKYANGTIVEDAVLHTNVSSIRIVLSVTLNSHFSGIIGSCEKLHFCSQPLP